MPGHGVATSGKAVCRPARGPLPDGLQCGTDTWTCVTPSLGPRSQPWLWAAVGSFLLGGHAILLACLGHMHPGPTSVLGPPAGGWFWGHVPTPRGEAPSAPKSFGSQGLAPHVRLFKWEQRHFKTIVCVHQCKNSHNKPVLL